MEEFVYILIAAVALFLIGGALAGLPELQGSNINQTILSIAPGMIGNIESSFRDVNFGTISVGKTRGVVPIRNIVELSVKNGLFINQPLEVKFHASNPRDGKLSFEVFQTNKFAPLRIILNNRTLFREHISSFTPVSVKLTGLRSGENELIIQADPSYFRFWAPNAYLLRNLTLSIQDTGIFSFKQAIEFFPYELRGLAHVKLSFFVTEAVRTDPLEIKMNGNTIYRERPLIKPDPYVIVFYSNSTEILPGENTLSIATGNNANYRLEGVALSVNYFGNDRRESKKFIMQLDQAHLDYLNRKNTQGKVVIDARPFLPGTTSIRINNRTFTTTLTPGENTVYFTKDDVFVGENELIITSDGTYDLRHVKVDLVRR